jgi:hypothetical protein
VPFLRLIWKWLFIAIGGGLVIMFLPTLTNTDLPGPPDWVPDFVLEISLWPVAICLRLSGPGVNIGTPQKPFYEGTPLQLFASDVGVGLSWVFFMSVSCFYSFGFVGGIETRCPQTHKINFDLRTLRAKPSESPQACLRSTSWDRL